VKPDLTPELRADIATTVARALEEDVGSGDLTAALLAPEKRERGHIITREDAVFCGRPWAEAIFHQIDPDITLAWRVDDGDPVAAGDVLVELEGRGRSLVTAERTVLNFLQLLSGTATTTHGYVALIAGTGATILDTRKTIPGLRRAQKYAVACGGGRNHRMGLFDAFLIKENHIAAAGSIGEAIRQAREYAPGRTVEIEVERIEQLKEALAARPDTILLDNFTPASLGDAVAIVRNHPPDQQPKLEASGGIDASTIRVVAESGVDYISIGSLTKHLRAIDLSMRLL
jgi:nicotinate-nucleotide pyrophosphorylase (carboxylating)